VGGEENYSAWLPAGEYEVSRLGNRQGVMAAYSKSLRFSVAQGRLNYLGEVVYDCSYAADTVVFYGVIDCGILALGRCIVPRPSVNVCVVDRQHQTVDYFLRQHSEYSNLPIKNALMR
jgi:hypothetical protein